MEQYKEKLNQSRNKHNKPLSERTKATYIRNLENLIKNCGMDWSLDNINPYLSKFSLSQRANYLNSICSFMTLLDYPQNSISMYKEERMKYSDLNREQGLSEKKLKNCCEWDEIIKWRDLVILKNKQIEELGKEVSLDKLQLECLLRLYTTYQRRNEYADLIFYDNHMEKPEGDNLLYYNTDDNKMYLIFGDYKTKGKYGTQQLEITNEQGDMNNKTFLLTYIMKNNRNPIMFKTRALGRAKEERQLTRLNLTKILNRSSEELIGKTISSDRIRKAYYSKFKDIKKQLTDDSYNNTHSTNTILNNYVV